MSSDRIFLILDILIHLQKQNVYTVSKFHQLLCLEDKQDMSLGSTGSHLHRVKTLTPLDLRCQQHGGNRLPERVSSCLAVSCSVSPFPSCTWHQVYLMSKLCLSCFWSPVNTRAGFPRGLVFILYHFTFLQSLVKLEVLVLQLFKLIFSGPVSFLILLLFCIPHMSES